jgi:hypothetical protein
MVDYTITLSVTEDKALSYVAFSQSDWINNVVKERCRIAIEEIVQLTVQRCIAESVQIPNTKEEIVDLAFERGWVKTAAERHEEINQPIIT